MCLPNPPYIYTISLLRILKSGSQLEIMFQMQNYDTDEDGTYDWKYALPACYRVRTNNRMDCLQVGTDVLGIAPRFGVEVKAVLFGNLTEVVSFECG